jgi:hypothetical protein
MIQNAATGTERRDSFLNKPAALLAQCDSERGYRDRTPRFFFEQTRGSAGAV